ncbi:hypothetical protein BS78_05G222700, partial [Paspalum vaginatum]
PITSPSAALGPSAEKISRGPPLLNARPNPSRRPAQKRDDLLLSSARPLASSARPPAAPLPPAAPQRRICSRHGRRGAREPDPPPPRRYSSSVFSKPDGPPSSDPLPHLHAGLLRTGQLHDVPIRFPPAATTLIRAALSTSPCVHRPWIRILRPK